MIPIVSSAGLLRIGDWAYIFPGNRLCDFLEKSTQVTEHKPELSKRKNRAADPSQNKPNLQFAEVYQSIYKALEPHKTGGRSRGDALA
jgi:hypothetical protein